MMLRSLLLGLLIAGITPINLADAVVPSSQKKFISSSQSSTTSIKFASSCIASGSSANCLSPAIYNKEEINPDLWLQDMANILLASTMLPVCLQNSSFSKITNPRCFVSWKKLFHLEPENTQSFPSGPLGSNYNHPHNSSQSTQPESAPQKFPKLSRSSLIVSFPQENSSFVPKKTKLANPAPKTKRIASPFGWRRRPYSNQLQFHEGIDYGAPLGSPVVAVGNGIVTKIVSGCLDFGSLACGGQLGNWIEIDHGNGAIATYGHLKYSSITVKEGMKVWKNQLIAQVGSSGWSTGAHLDFRLKINGKNEDPTKYVNSDTE
ncbi:MAG: M23 family metallopeptidase [Pleurocapsa sp. MO_192.B19]|nr:M23 family metallopeptidase [Pleurocapsa sp. MO_192.B19]